MDRAYTLLSIKSVDEDKRIVEGIATTPSVDRVGDVVEPKGAEFKLPLPLLWQHNHDQPIGHVIEASVTRNGIRIKAQIARVAEDGTLRARLDEAWQSIKSGLVRGLSIGFQALDRERMEDGDGRFSGYRFLRWAWLELSAVTIPANQDASILAIKQFDTQQRAASGRRSALPGVSGLKPQTKGSTAMKTVEDIIRALDEERATKSARIEEIAPDENGNFESEDAKKEYRSLVAEVKELDEKISDQEGRLLASKTARPVTGKDVRSGSEARQRVTNIKDNVDPGIGFARYAMCLAAAKGSRADALAIAKHRYPSMDSLHNYIKAVTVAGSTADPNYSILAETGNFTGDFISLLEKATIIGKFGQDGIPSLRRVPFNIKVPAQTSRGAAAWVGQGKAKPVVGHSFDSVTLTYSKLAAISVLNDELVRVSTPSAEALVRQSLIDAIVAKMDVDFVNPSVTSSADNPASITVSGTPTQASGGDTAADVREDVKWLMGQFIAADNPLMSGVWIMQETTALALMLMRNELGQDEFPGITVAGGRFMGLPVITSQHVQSGQVILVNASDIYLADDGQVAIDISNQATVAMNTTPAGASNADDSPPTVTGLGGGAEGADLVSLWQQNAIGIRAERWIHWKKRRSSAVAYISSVSWGTPGSP